VDAVGIEPVVLREGLGDSSLITGWLAYTIAPEPGFGDVAARVGFRFWFSGWVPRIFIALPIPRTV